MDRMWVRGSPATVREILEELQQDRSIAYTTVMTVMDSLYKKGWLRRQLEGKAYRYEPVASRESYSAALMNDALAQSRDRAAAFVHFLEQISPQDAQALRDALRWHGRRKGGSP